MELIKKYFQGLSQQQEKQYSQLWELYQDWNSKINVISRKDIDNLYANHVLHSLSIARFLKFNPGAEILDLGTGGGFPGIPLAILYPDVKFTLIDGTRKKIKVCQEVIEALGLDNAFAVQKRAEETKHKYDFVVTRAVAHIEKLMEWSRRLLKNIESHALPNGVIALKGGKIEEELATLPDWEYYEIKAIQDFFAEDNFADKYIIYVQG